MGYVVVENVVWQNQQKGSLVVVLGTTPSYNPATDVPKGKHAQFFVEAGGPTVVQRSWQVWPTAPSTAFFLDVPTRTQNAKWFDPPAVFDNPWRPTPRTVTDFIQSSDLFAGHDTYGWPDYPYPPFWTNEQRGTLNVLQFAPTYQFQNDMFLLRQPTKFFAEPEVFWRGQQPLSRAYDYVPYLNELQRPSAKWFDDQPVFWDYHQRGGRVILDSFTVYNPATDVTQLKPQAKWFDPQAVWWDSTYRVTINATTFLPPPYNPATDPRFAHSARFDAVVDPIWVNPMLGTTPVLNTPPAPTPPPEAVSFLFRWRTRVIFDPKKLSEQLTIPVDFISRLGVNESITSATVTCSVYSGVDNNPQAMVNGPATISGTVVLQSISGGILGNTYELLYSVLTSKGNTIELAGYFVIEPDLP